MITYLEGDATRPCKTPAIIVHVCNDVGKWGAGFTGALTKRWPEVERQYRRMIRLRKNTGGRALGMWWIHQINDEPIEVANLVAQRGIKGDGSPSPNISYPVLENCLTELATEIHRSMPGHSIHMGRIGCGHGGGSWTVVEAIIQRTCGDLEVFVYDRPGVPFVEVNP